MRFHEAGHLTVKSATSPAIPSQAYFTILTNTIEHKILIELLSFKIKIATFISTVYNSVDDIDRFVGDLSEFPVAGSITGPTFSCLMGENFANVKYADRYCYEVGGQVHSFSTSKLTKYLSVNF